MKRIEKYYKVYGRDGHRQRESFGISIDWFGTCRGNKVCLLREDFCFCNDYAIIGIIGNSDAEVEEELQAQLNDGLFENSRFGRVEEVK